MFIFTRTLRMTILLAALSLTALLLTGCATLPPPPMAPFGSTDENSAPAKDVVVDPAALVDVEWRLAEIRPTGGDVLKADDPAKYTVAFETDGRFSGQLNCNRMMGSYELDDGQLTFGPIATTMAFCPEDALFVPYTTALNAALSYGIVDGQLVVVYAGGELVYAPAGEDEVGVSVPDAPAIVGVVWQLQAIRMMNDEIFTPGDADVYTLELFADGAASGQADCNRFNGSYTADASQLTFGPLMSTRAMCPETSLYDRYMQGLGDATSYVLEAGTLAIAFGPDAGILEFAPAPESAGVAEADLANGVYQGIYDEAIALTDGSFVGKPFVDGGASRPTVNLLPDMTALGDLNGDGIADGAAVLAENSGGSGTFVYLAAVVAQKGTAVNGATLLLGDRLRVESVAIEEGQIVLVAGTFAEGDPLCCPSQHSRFVYGLEEGALVELSAELQ